MGIHTWMNERGILDETWYVQFLHSYVNKTKFIQLLNIFYTFNYSIL